MNPQFPELGYYTLPGHVSDPKLVIEEVKIGDELGLGSVWISERLNTKNVEVLSGVAAAVSGRMGIASGLIANLPLRNPLVTAAYASTMMKLTDNRFALGVGRGVDGLADATGTARLNFKLLEDYIGILRQLWRGESVTYDGIAGNLRGVTLGMTLDPMPPVIMAVMGDKTAYWAGRFCDGVVYNSLWTKQAVEHSTCLVRKGAEDAGRDPKSVKVWTILVTACEVSEDIMLKDIVRRMNTYLLFPPMFDSICDANGWDKKAAIKLREALSKIDGDKKKMQKGMMGDENTSRNLDDVRRTFDLYPKEWIYEGNAVGTADECAQCVRDRFDAGADGVLLHGSHPSNLAPLLKVWPKYRPVGIFDKRSANPGL
jgi:5,10-methylenetetrahydromethanopterin reductase